LSLRHVSSTDLEASVRGFHNATFQSCFSATEGKVLFQLFTEEVVQMLNSSEFFNSVRALTPQERMEVIKETLAAQPITSSKDDPTPTPPSPAVVLTPTPPSSQQAAESSRAASKRKAVDPPPVPHETKTSRPGDGWYVVQVGVVPGVYYGM
jgi:cell division septation protein DedD